MKKRELPQQIHLGLMSVLLAGVLVLSYQVAGQHNRRLDLTRDKVYSLAPETIEALKRIDRERIRVTAFFSDQDPSKKELEVYLEEARTQHPHFHFHFYDPDRSPSEARKYHVDHYRTTVFEAYGRQERMEGVSEEAFTNALIRLAHPVEKMLCFTRGHGENSISDTERSGLSEWKKVLESHQFKVQEIDMVSAGIPKECDAVVMTGPRYEIFPKELDLLQRTPSEGKGLLLLIDPMDRGEGKGYHELLAPYGIELGDNVVVDKMSKIIGGDYLIPLVSQYAEHPVTRGFNAATFLSIARTVTRKPKTAEGLQVTELAFTTPGSWAETNLKKLENGEAELTPGEDTPGPLSLAAVSEGVGSPEGARVAVVGDSEFINNANLRLSGNRDFSLNLLQWLVRDDRWISVRTKQTQFEPLFLKGGETTALAGFSIGVLPLAALFLGSVGIWFRRKRSS